MQQGAGEPEDFSFVVDGNGDFPILVAFLRGREKMLAPVLLPGDRAPELHCGRRNDRLLGVEGRLCAEAATHVRRDHTDCLKVAFEEIGKRRAAKVRRLRCRPHRQHVRTGIVICEHGAAFEGHGPAAMQEKFVLEDVCGARECRLDVAVAHGDDGGDIAREVAVCGRSIGPRGFAAVADHRQRLEVHVDGCGGVFREIAIVCDRDRDGLTDIAHFTAR